MCFFHLRSPIDDDEDRRPLLDQPPSTVHHYESITLTIHDILAMTVRVQMAETGCSFVLFFPATNSCEVIKISNSKHFIVDPSKLGGLTFVETLERLMAETKTGTLILEGMNIDSYVASILCWVFIEKVEVLSLRNCSTEATPIVNKMLHHLGHRNLFIENPRLALTAVPFHAYDIVHIHKTGSGVSVHATVCDFDLSFTLGFGEDSICSSVENFGKEKNAHLDVSMFVGASLAAALEKMMEGKRAVGLRLTGVHLDRAMARDLYNSCLDKIDHLSLIECTGEGNKFCAHTVALFLGHHSLSMVDNDWTAGDSFLAQLSGLKMLEMKVESLTPLQSSFLSVVPFIVLHVGDGVEEDQLAELFKIMNGRHSEFSLSIHRPLKEEEE